MAASTEVILSGRNFLVIDIHGVFSAADETDTIVVDRSTLTGPLGTVPGSLRVDEISWATNGYNYIQLEWEHTTDDIIAHLSGSGYVDYSYYGGKNDPETEGGTGDIVLTSNGGAAGGSYYIQLFVTLKA
jgi:hypothetical protein